MNEVIQVQNPLIDHYVGVIRDEKTGKCDFAIAIENIVYLMSSSITGNIGTAKKTVKTPMADTEVAYFIDKILVIPILRAGLAMFEPIRKLVPQATFGYVGIKRKQEQSDDSALPNFSADMYYCNLPPNLHEFRVIILDIVVATGSTVEYVINHLLEQGVPQEKISLASIISSQEGISVLQAKFPKVQMLTCALDPILTDEGMIVPGLGDAGNRYNGYDVPE